MQHMLGEKKLSGAVYHRYSPLHNYVHDLPHTSYVPPVLAIKIIIITERLKRGNIGMV